MRSDRNAQRLEAAALTLRHWAEALTQEILTSSGELDLQRSSRLLTELERFLRPPRWRVRIARVRRFCSQLLRRLPGWRRWWPWAGTPAPPDLRLRSFQEAWWPWIAHRAWHEARFQENVARCVLDQARAQHLAVVRDPSGSPQPGELPLPRIDPQTWWLLLDLLAVPALRNLDRRGLYRPHRRLAIRLARRSGRQLRQGPNQWAGFWDQWLITEAYLRARPKRRSSRRRRPFADRLLAAMPQAISRIQAAGLSFVAPTDEEPPDVLSHDPQKRGPAWMELS